MTKHSRLIGNVLKILDFLIQNGIVDGHSRTVSELMESIGIPAEEYDAAESYLFQQNLVGWTIAGRDGHRWVTAKGIDFYEKRISLPNSVSDPHSASSPRMNSAMPDRRKVFVVHGRDDRLRNDFFAFLRSLDLKPIEWSEAIKLTGKASPYIGEILERAFDEAQAVLVLLSPDDEVRLHPGLQLQNEKVHERQLCLQARPNVLFEAGMAFGKNPDRTLLIEVGEVKPFSDMAGRFTVRLTNAADKRKDVAERLKTAGCSVDLSGTDWLRTGDFLVERGEVRPVSEDASQEPSIKWVDLSYPEIAGIQAALESQGSKIMWCSDDNLARRLDFEGWSVYYGTEAGRRVILKIKDRPNDLTLIVKSKSGHD